ncbi:DNA-binding transcriptional regulator, FadR family [Amycolatopsis arida]|uniref:DNA-binding transcriptional regulator, FadR family n=1 Tax=Amycolatopsis arida TaxID=587909 RepID=A0A1I5KK92_9PSEU|nr:FCD domain-containing protein [Amycolatopsis arida]TDX97087.1 DNA-binding FadR family transcriptional regulator [Amycolatopsis arida]SFO85402.1 DNA-binding transcriptional regulator, FadR family [Amycolatopsis arida]
MPLATTRRTGLVEQVIGQLRAAVTQGDWPVGQRIPPEAELAARLGVGRNTVREAVRALAHGGLLEVRQGDGTYVRATSEVSGAIRRLCGSELREVLQVRRVLEVEGARLAARHRTAEELRLLTDLLDERDRIFAERPFAEFARVDAEFHFAVVRCGRNALLTEIYRGLTEAVTASVAATSDPYPEPAPIEHGGLLRAIADGDPERAAAEASGFLDQLLAGQDQTAR